MTLWGGRFEAAPADALWRFTVDDSDRRLLADDVAGSLAHASMLAEAGLMIYLIVFYMVTLAVETALWLPTGDGSQDAVS